ncbi:MAG: hypothetical protein ACK4IY_06425, partial [Chitinophagales bacterium]
MHRCLPFLLLVASSLYLYAQPENTGTGNTHEAALKRIDQEIREVDKQLFTNAYLLNELQNESDTINKSRILRITEIK